MGCPCGSQKEYNNCCGAIINGERDASTAEELMRSRYTAFTLADGNYLLKSHHSLKRPSTKEKKEIEKWAKSVSWVGLTVISKKDGQQNDSTGYVEFKALFMEDGKINDIYENSLFKRENGKWVYF